MVLLAGPPPASPRWGRMIVLVPRYGRCGPSVLPRKQRERPTILVAESEFCQSATTWTSSVTNMRSWCSNLVLLVDDGSSSLRVCLLKRLCQIAAKKHPLEVSMDVLCSLWVCRKPLLWKNRWSSRAQPTIQLCCGDPKCILLDFTETLLASHRAWLTLTSDAT